MKPKMRVPSRTLLLGLVAAMAWTQPAAAVRNVGATPMTSSPASTDVLSGGYDHLSNGYSCSCEQTYRNGADMSVSTCDDTQSQCADLDVVQGCEDDPDGPDCNYLVRCECDCTALAQTTEFEHGPFDDVVLTGIPDLWQFDYMCGSNAVSANAVGCGPVSAAMVMYWWAQRGYGHLVDDYLVGGGSGPAEQEHDWQALVRELRAHYLNGGICVPFGGGQYATLMGKMTTGIEEYIEDAGYHAVVNHWKVCDDCNAGADDEITGGAALDLIKDELDAGRPVIMGFNAGQAFDGFIPVWNGSAMETVYIGELSNGAPADRHDRSLRGHHRLSPPGRPRRPHHEPRLARRRHRREPQVDPGRQVAAPLHGQHHQRTRRRRVVLDRPRGGRELQSAGGRRVLVSVHRDLARRELDAVEHPPAHTAGGHELRHRPRGPDRELLRHDARGGAMRDGRDAPRRDGSPRHVPQHR